MTIDFCSGQLTIWGSYSVIRAPDAAVCETRPSAIGGPPLCAAGGSANEIQVRAEE
jgi:hypothetical protein